MDKLVIGLLGAFAGLATAGSAQAATAPTPNPAEGLNNAVSYAELLEPVPNAVDLLKADDAARAMQQSKDGVQQVDYYGGYEGGYHRGYDRGYAPRYEHHHHHHYGERYGYYRRGPSQHHHHHHHYDRYRGRNDFIGIPGVGGFVVGR